MVKIILRDKIVGEKPLIIAELACAHDGSLEQAKKMIDVAVNSGADIVQLLIYSLEDSYSPYNPNYELISKLHLSKEEWAELVNYSKQKGIPTSANVQDIASAKLIQELDVDMLKIHSCDVFNTDLVGFVARMNKPMIVTIGALLLEEIKELVNFIKAQGNDQIILMYGYQNYPTKTEGLNMKLIQSLKKELKLPVGYADHTDGGSELALTIPLVAAALGADLLEKHITINRSLKGTDYESSLDPPVFKKFVLDLKKVHEALGDGVFGKLSEDRRKYRTVSKSIVACRNIAKGEVITEEMITFMEAMPGGLPPADKNKIIGKKTIKDIPCYYNIYEEDMQ